MQGFRNFLRGPGGKILLALIILPFVISAFYGYFTGGNGGDVVAEVEGTSIYRNVVEQRVQQTRMNLRQQSPDIDPQLLDNFINPGMVLQGLVNNALILHAANDAGMKVSEEQAARSLMRFGEFQDQNGRFSQQIFDRQVRNMGYTPATFLAVLRDDILMNQIRAGYEDTDFGLPYELADLRRLGEQRRDISYIRVSAESLLGDFDISDEQVQAFYEGNQREFMRPQEFRLQYIELDRGAYLEGIEVTDAQVREEYQAREEMFRTVAAQQERRRVSHILIAEKDGVSEADALARAEALREQIESGADFADVAQESSDDSASASAGGALGVIGRGDLPEAMETAVFALAEGEVSAPVISDAGVHLLTVTQINQRSLPSFDELRESIVDELKTAQAENRLADDVARLEEMAFEHPDLQVPAETLGVSLEQTGFFPLSAPEGIAQHQGVMRELNNQAVREQGQNSPLVELAEGRYVVFRVAETQPEEQIPLAEVRDTIVRRLQLAEAQARLEAMAAEGEAALVDGQDLASLSGLWSRDVSTADALERGATQPDAELVERVFRLPRPAEGETGTAQVMRLGNGDLVAVTLDAVRDGDPEGLTEAQQRSALAQLGELEGAGSFRKVVSWLRETGKVKIYNDRLAGTVEE
jgi:peptidyl-prolyl cis-trans isomerase D